MSLENKTPSINEQPKLLFDNLNSFICEYSKIPLPIIAGKFDQTMQVAELPAKASSLISFNEVGKVISLKKASSSIISVPSGITYFSSILSLGYLINVFPSAENITPSIITF